MDIKKIVDKLKEFVAVEQTFDHDEDYILALSQELSLNADEIKALLNIVLSLICPPTDLQGILQGKKALLELLRQLCLHKDIEAAEQIFLTALLVKWFGFIEKSPALKYNRKVNMTQHPVFIFYVYASGYMDKKSFQTAFKKNEVPPLFRFYCLRFLQGIKKVMSSNVVDGTECDYLRAFRYFFFYANEEKKYDVALLEKQHEDYDFLLELIKDAVSNYDRIEWGNVSNKVGRSATEYEKKLIRILIENEDIHSHAHGSPDTTTTDYPYVRRSGLTNTTISGAKTDSDNDDEKFSTTHVTAASILMNQLTHGDLHDEFIDHDEFIHFDLLYDHSQSDTNDTKQDAIEKAVPRPPSLKHRWVDTLNLRSHKFFWEKNYDKLHHYSLIYSHIAESWDKFSDIEKSTVIFIILVMHTGVEPSLLFSLWNINDLNGLNFKEQHIYISKLSGRYVLYKPPLVSLKSQIEGNNLYRKISESVMVPLPHVICRLIDESPVNKENDGFFFSLRSPYNKASINIDMVSSFLKRVNQGTNKTALPITIASLAFSFFSTYSSRYGLDPILACYVSGQDYRLYGSTLHYIHVPAQHLEEKYLSVSEIVHKKILLNMEGTKMARRRIARKYLLPEAENKCLSGSSGIKSENPKADSDNSSDLGYGSRFVPLKENIVLYLTQLKAAIESNKWKEVIIRHNLYIAYCFLSMQFCLAYRPRNEIPYSFSEFCKNGRVVINDKLSHAYREDRCLPASSTLNILARNMRQGFDRVRRYIARKINPQMLRFEPELFFFFLAEDGRPLEFSLKRMINLLESVGLPYPFDLKTPRHYMRTYMYEHGVSHEIANAFMGHHHVAKEPLGITSALCYEEFLKILSSIIEEAIDEIGLSPVSYLPEGDDLY